MKTKDWLLLGVEAVALCGFISYALYSVGNSVSPFVGTLILATLGYMAVLCHLLR